MNQVWTALLVSIAVSLALSLFNWFYNNRNNNNELGIHWLFLFGLLVSKGKLIVS